MGAAYTWVKATLFLSAFTGAGLLLWAVVAPSEERKKEILKNVRAAARDGNHFVVVNLKPQDRTSKVRLLYSPMETAVRLAIELPEANPRQMSETRQRNILIMQTIKEAAETNENVARTSPWKK